MLASIKSGTECFGHGHVHLFRDICFHFIMHLVRASWQQTFHLYDYITLIPVAATIRSLRQKMPLTPAFPDP